MKRIAGCIVTAVALTLSVGPAQGGMISSGCDSACDVGICSDSFGCDASCDGCDGCISSHDEARLLGLFRASDHCFDDFISPMINPVFFEDPRTLTEARAIYARHETPNSVGSLGLPGGNAQLFALQLRAALTERLSIIATKDGYIVADFDEPPLGDLIDDGWAAVAAGLKYNVLRDPDSGTLLSVGTTYEIPIGSQRTQQDVGDGEFHMFGTFGQRLYGGNAHWLSAFGYRLPVDGEVQSSMVHWSNHFDVRVTKRVYLFTELVWWHWTDSADTGLPIGVSGHDLFDLSATNVDGLDLVTQNVGLKYKPSGRVEAGVAYEFPLTEFQDIIDNRVQLELIVRY